MASKTDMKNINRLVQAIKQKGPIDKYNLIMSTGISISLYDKIKPFLLNVFAHQVDYNPTTKIWTFIQNEAPVNAPA